MASKKRIVFLTDEDGWVDAIDFQPQKFDLVMVKNETGRQQLAWWTGFVWDYGHKRIPGEIIKWKRLPQGYEYL